MNNELGALINRLRGYSEAEDLLRSERTDLLLAAAELERLKVLNERMLSALYHVSDVAESYMDFDPDSRFGGAIAEVESAITASQT